VGGEEDEGPAAGLLDGDAEQMQVRLERVWNALRLPEGQRLDMAIKYSSHEYRDHLLEVEIMRINSPGFPLQSSRFLCCHMDLFVLSGNRCMGGGCSFDPEEGALALQVGGL